MTRDHRKLRATVVALGLAVASAMQAVAVEWSAVSPAELEGEVTVWSWNIAAASLKKLVPPFNEIYPNVTVDVNMTGTNLQSRFLLSLSAGVGAPDISQLQLAEAQRYVRTGRMTDLTPVAQRYEKDFPASFWADCVYEGKVYAIPWDMGPCGVFYKRGLFARYGIDPNAIETWADYIEVGKQIRERSGGKTHMLFLGSGDMASLFEILLRQAGGQVFDDEGRIAIDSPQTRQVLDVLRAMIASGITADAMGWSHEFFASFQTDSVATYVSAVWFGGSIRDYAGNTHGDWGVFRLPAFESGGLRTSNLGGSVLVIPDQCARKEAAWAYVEFALCTHQAQLEQYRSFDLFPAYLPTHSDPFFDEPEPFYGGQCVRRLFSQDIERIPVLHRTRDWMEALRYIQQALSKWVANGMGNSNPFLDDLAQRLSRRLARPIAPEAP